MYCRKCGAQNDDNANKCLQCGEALQTTAKNVELPQKIPNYLAQSILVTIFCCLPFGIAAIVFAAQVNSKIQAGDIQGAMASSRMAKIWSWWAFGVGIVFQIAYGAFTLFIETARTL
ncbi:MAG: CD225/dispanin family protein [Kiritimatiellae bacterium]|jgi:hypothetical protein|nr:CD225/dispanin family protein [Kiritimatiellia bacterium]